MIYLTKERGSSRANQEAQPACFTQSAHRNPVGTVSSETKQDCLYESHLFSTQHTRYYPITVSKSNGQLLQ